MPLSSASIVSAPFTSLPPHLADSGRDIFTPEALGFISALVTHFGPRRDALLAARAARQQTLDAGIMPDFLPHTRAIREAAWSVAAIPEDLLDRRVEITGPVERKMMINALNSGAKVFMADFEDSLTPSWENIVNGQINLRDAVNRTLTYTSPEGKAYALNTHTSVLIVRPRGWHLDERHVTHEGRAIPAALLDFGMYLYTNAHALLAQGSGPYFYLPKLESAEEAQLWADIFAFSEAQLGLKQGTIKATVLIETILATFEMEEILYALRDYCVGLNCGRWDYIFSFIKKFSTHPDFVLPDRAQVTMTTHFLRSYSRLLIATCHKRGAFAMGGMSAYIPVKGDEKANENAFAMVRADKEREAGDGHDGTWVAHPGLIPVAMDVFNRLMPGKNQLHIMPDTTHITAQDLLTVPTGTITEAGMRNNISVSLRYLAHWLNGQGCVPINNLMEDAATAEIARAQLWQWLHHDKGVLEDGRRVTEALFEQFLGEELDQLKPDTSLPFDASANLLTELVGQAEFTEFLTIPAYALIA